jgi:hypothetical protein
MVEVVEGVGELREWERGFQVFWRSLWREQGRRRGLKWVEGVG